MAIKQFFKDLFVIDGEEVDVIETEDRQVSKSTEPRTKSKVVNITETTKQPRFKSAPKNETNQSQRKKTGDVDMSKINTKVCLFEPYVFGETQDIADQLKNNQTALVNLTKLDKVQKKRIIDFLSGTVYALEGDIQKVGADIFLCTPNSVGVEGVISDKKDSDTM